MGREAKVISCRGKKKIGKKNLDAGGGKRGRATSGWLKKREEGVKTQYAH